MGINLKSGLTQIYFVGFICFCCPGIFNALNSLGGAGKVDASTANAANVALYSCFAIVGLFAGALFNILGPKILMFSGGITYAFYAICQYLAGQSSSYNSLAIFSGALLGCGAGLLWTAQGAIMMAYPTEKRKGTYISIFWIIFNLGGFIGGLITFGLNYNTVGGNANPATYFTFCALMIIGSLMAFFLLAKPYDVIKEDGTSVEFQKAQGPIYEISNILQLFTNKYMLLLLPLFLCSNWFYTYQFNAVNGYLFTARTKGLNSALYWGSQMIAAYLLGNVFLDTNSKSRRWRAIGGGVIVIIVMFSAWIFGYFLQTKYERYNDPSDEYAESSIDYTSSNYGYPFFVFILYGFSDAIVQCYAYWIMGALSNDMSVVSRYAGFYKGIQSAGAAIAWSIDLNLTGYMTQLSINWILFSFSIIPMMIVAYSIKETSVDEMPLKNDSLVFIDRLDKDTSSSNSFTTLKSPVEHLKDYETIV